MSVDYANGLSYYDDLGVCGLDERFETKDELKVKIEQLAGLICQHKGSCVVHVGAGLSTAAGIRDFRGRDGVWTELLRQQQTEHRSPSESVNEDTKASGDADRKVLTPFDETKPTLSHLILKELCELGYIRHIVSQNVDGLFLKANLARRFISELHGNFYLDECTKCRSRFIRNTASKTMRLQKSSIRCPRNIKQDKDGNERGDNVIKPSSEMKSSCKGFLRDTILDWESSIPIDELRIATRESKASDLHICIGTSLQLQPSKDLVCKPSSKKILVIINLQPTQFDKHANLIINYYADDVMRELASKLNLTLPEYKLGSDPTKKPDLIGTRWLRKP